MPGAGTTVRNPHSGETITFLETARETGGEHFKMEIRVEGGREGMVGPDHFHPTQVERFEVVVGSARFRLDGREFDAAAGDTVTVPVGGVHIFGNAGPAELVMTATYSPAPRTVETFFQTVFSLAAEGRFYRPDGRPRALAAIRVMHHCREYMITTSPPPALQRLAYPALAGLARITGVELRHPEPSM